MNDAWGTRMMDWKDAGDVLYLYTVAAMVGCVLGMMLAAGG